MELNTQNSSINNSKFDELRKEIDERFEQIKNDLEEKYPGFGNEYKELETINNTKENLKEQNKGTLKKYSSVKKIIKKNKYKIYEIAGTTAIIAFFASPMIAIGTGYLLANNQSVDKTAYVFENVNGFNDLEYQIEDIPKCIAVSETLHDLKLDKFDGDLYDIEIDYVQLSPDEVYEKIDEYKDLEKMCKSDHSENTGKNYYIVNSLLRYNEKCYNEFLYNSYEPLISYGCEMAKYISCYGNEDYDYKDYSLIFSNPISYNADGYVKYHFYEDYDSSWDAYNTIVSLPNEKYAYDIIEATASLQAAYNNKSNDSEAKEKYNKERNKVLNNFNYIISSSYKNLTKLEKKYYNDSEKSK